MYLRLSWSEGVEVERLHPRSSNMTTAIQPSDSAERHFVIEPNVSCQVIVTKTLIATFGDHRNKRVAPQGSMRSLR